MSGTEVEQAPAEHPDNQNVSVPEPQRPPERQQPTNAVPQYQVPASSELEQWARDAHLISTVAVRLVQTEFVPRSFKGNSATAVAAILTGQEIGLKPMAALRSIDVIEGTPAMRAIAMRALVQASGHEIWTAESNATRAIVRGRRKGSDNVEESIWTIDRARTMNLVGKDNWKKQPTAMLLARATSECARLVAADVLLGVPYSSEELQDLGPEAAEAAVETVSSVAAPKRTTKRKPLPVQVAEPDLPSDDAATQPEPSAEGLSGPAEELDPQIAVPERDPAEPTDEEYAAAEQKNLPVTPAVPIGGWPVRPVPSNEPIPFPEPELDWDPPEGGDAA